MINNRLGSFQTPRLRTGWDSLRRGTHCQGSCKWGSPEMEKLKKTFFTLSTIYLIKHSPVSTEEAPLGCLNHCTLVVLNRQADVENLKIQKTSWEIFYFKSSIIPDTRSEHQRSIRIPGPRMRMCQSTGSGGYPRFLKSLCHQKMIDNLLDPHLRGGCRCPPEPGRGWGQDRGGWRGRGIGQTGDTSWGGLLVIILQMVNPLN